MTPLSDHFDGKRFRNTPDGDPRGFIDLLRWLTSRKPGPWSEPRDAHPGPPPPALVAEAELRVTWVGQATTLIQMDGRNILTDPVWSARASPLSFLGPRRVRPPGLRFQDLPAIHAVVVSHNHYDHLDLDTLERLERAHRPRFFVGLGNGGLLRSKGLRDVVELDWWQSGELLGGARATFTPARHFSSRGLFDRNRTLWGGWALESAAGLVYFAGDTGYGPHFTEIARRLGEPRLALLPIGAFLPYWFMGPVHMTPHEAVRAHRDLGAAQSMAIHFGTFPLADDGEREAVDLLCEARAAAGLSPESFAVPEFGSGRRIPATRRQ